MKCAFCATVLKRYKNETESHELVSGWHCQTAYRRPLLDEGLPQGSFEGFCNNAHAWQAGWGSQYLIVGFRRRNAAARFSGDPMPPYKGGLRLFAMRFCQYVQRTILVLKAKGLQYDIVFVNLKNKPEWLFDYSPKGTVPALEYESGKALFDSTVINVYLDEKYPKPKLQSSDPLRRAQDKLLLENFAPVQSIYYTAGFNPSAVETSHVEIYHKGLEILQKELEGRGTTFLHGKEPGLVDYSIWPFLERFEALPYLNYKNEQFALNENKYIRLLKYMEDMKRHPVVHHSYLPPEVHAKYLKTRIQGDPDFNMLTPTSIL